MSAIPEATLVLDAGAHVAESPLWDASTGCLLWVDIEREEVHHFDPSTGNDRMIDVGQSVGAVAGRRRGGYVLAVADGFAVLAIKAPSPEPSAIDVTSVPRRPMRSGTGAITGAAMIEASVSTVSGSATTGTGKSNSAAMRCGTGWNVCNRSVPANMADSSSGSRPAGAVLTPLRPSGATGPPPPPTSQP